MFRRRPDQRTARMPALEPTPGERARTIVRAAPTLLVSLSDRAEDQRAEATLVLHHGQDRQGNPIMVVSCESGLVQKLRAGPNEVAGIVEGWSLTPAQLSDRARGWVRLDGWVREATGGDRVGATEIIAAHGGPIVGRGDAVLILDVVAINLVDGHGHHEPGLEDYTTSLPDPLVGAEASMVEHLNRDHVEQVYALNRLVRRVVGSLVTEPIVVGFDRFGIRMRGSVPSTIDTRGHVDVHLPFEQPVRNAAELPLALAGLVQLGHTCRCE